VRLTAAEKAEVIRLVEGSDLSVRRTLAELGVHRSTFYAWYRRYTEAGDAGLVPQKPGARRYWNRIPPAVRQHVVDAAPLLQKLVVRRTASAIELANRVVIEVHTCSYRTTRGYAFAAVVADECAFWRDESSATPDIEVLNAVRPGLATIPGSLLVAISSPHSRRGALWQAFKNHYGKDGDPVLVWQAPTRAMNPTVPKHIIEDALVADESAARAEYLAEFRSDLESYISREIVEACVVPGRYEMLRLSGAFHVGFVDPSGGSADAMTLAVAHRESDGTAVLDYVGEVRPPFSPESVVQDFATVLRSYGISRVMGDRYAGEWPRERFAAHGITYDPCEKSKGELYALLLPVLNSRKVALLDHGRLVSQLCALERRTAWGGRDSIDHGPGGHDDVANAVAGAVAALAHQGGGLYQLAMRELAEFDAKRRAAGALT
jgi:transposase-like protein